VVGLPFRGRYASIDSLDAGGNMKTKMGKTGCMIMGRIAGFMALAGLSGFSIGY
jgi:hypothetical protein